MLVVVKNDCTTDIFWSLKSNPVIKFAKRAIRRQYTFNVVLNKRKKVGETGIVGVPDHNKNWSKKKGMENLGFGELKVSILFFFLNE